MKNRERRKKNEKKIRIKNKAVKEKVNEDEKKKEEIQ